MYNVLELKKSYGSTAILRDISLRIDDGEAVTIIGPSGSGKSTFLRCLNLLEEPTGGKIYFDNTLLDKDLDSKWLHQQVGMVFQKFNLFPMFTVLKNVMYAPMHVKHMPRKEAEELARDLLDRVVFMDKGYIVEEGQPQQIFEQPQQERTQNFLRSLSLGGAFA